MDTTKPSPSSEPVRQAPVPPQAPRPGAGVELGGGIVRLPFGHSPRLEPPPKKAA